MATPDRAVQLAREAYDAAIAELEDLPDAGYKDTTMVLQLISDNMTLWATELVQEEDEELARKAAEEAAALEAAEEAAKAAKAQARAEAAEAAAAEAASANGAASTAKK